MVGLLDLMAQGSPAAPDEVSGAIAGTLASDPARLAYGGPLGQTLGQISGGFYQAQARDAAQRIADMHTAAQPSLLRAYASDDPVATIANDPDAPAWAKYMMINQTPAQVAQAKLQMAQGATARALLPRAQAIGEEAARGGLQIPTLPGAGGAPGSPAASASAPFQFPGRITPAAGPTPPAETPPAAADPVEAVAAMPPGPQRATAANNLNPADLYRLRQILARQKARQPAVQLPGS
ncbi:MAG TPA: hypothetical protein VGF39_03920 [Stellaceae bacterium]